MVVQVFFWEMTPDIVVLKFGSSVLRTREDLPVAVHEIYRWYREGHRVLAVVSAIGSSTDALLAEASSFTPEPMPHATAELLATGERRSAALLGIVLDRAGIPARVADPREIGFEVRGHALDSEPTGLNAVALRAMFATHPVVVVPGFFGCDHSGRLQLLGRGGSDLSAVFFAAALGASRCRLIKDVDGVYEVDPSGTPGNKVGRRAPRRLPQLSYAKALEVAGTLVQPKAIAYAQANNVQVEVAGAGLPYESRIGAKDFELAYPYRTREPTRVILLGLGMVGMGVYQRLNAMPDHFRVVGALVRDRRKYEAEVPSSILHTTARSIGEVDADVVVDALPGLEPSRLLTRHFIVRGISIVSANTAMIAETAPKLSALATGGPASVRYSAAVGAGAPMVEAVRREAASAESEGRRLSSISGVLNGKCNLVLSHLAAGLSLKEAIHEAQACELGEIDPQEDLSGNDAARELRILARHAFGLDIDELEIEPLDEYSLRRARDAAPPGHDVVRMVAIAWRDHARVLGRVHVLALPPDDVLARAPAGWDALVITRSDGLQRTVTGRGAGRWPATEAIIADLFDLRRARLLAAETADRQRARQDAVPDHQPARDEPLVAPITVSRVLEEK